MSKRKKGGRPPKLAPEILARICDALRAGNYRETAAAYAGVRKSTLYDWLRRGAKAPRGIYRELHDAVEKALADSEARDVALIGKAADRDWQAAAWRLERKFPERWGRRQHHDVDANIKSTVKVSSEEAIKELNRLLVKKTPAGGTEENS
jgi:hypothetical protein